MTVCSASINWQPLKISEVCVADAVILSGLFHVGSGSIETVPACAF